MCSGYPWGRTPSPGQTLSTSHYEHWAGSRLPQGERENERPYQDRERERDSWRQVRRGVREGEAGKQSVYSCSRGRKDGKGCPENIRLKGCRGGWGDGKWRGGEVDMKRFRRLLEGLVGV